MADEYIVRIEDPIYIQAVSSVDPLLVYLRGYNAYEVAVQAGFDGTREEWLASLAEEATLICEGYRDEAEGFRNEAQTARDELDPVLINIATLLAIGAKLTEIDTVSDNIDAILTVNADLILGLSSKIGIVAGSIANVNNVGASIANVNSVAEKLSEVETVAGDLTNIDTVAGEIDDVNTVATNIADVNLAADNIVAIQAAPTYAEAAEKWAENPEDSPVETGKYSALHHSAKASAAQTAAEAAQDKAEDWAEETEDVEVESGKYSAKHWAAKAEDVVDEAYAVVENKIDKTAVKQEIGASTTDVMSQKAVTDELAQLAGDVNLKAAHGYSELETVKTLKEVEDTLNDNFNRFLTDIEKYLLPGYYIAPNGTYLQSATYTVVDKFIPVLEGIELEFYRSTGQQDTYDKIAFYDSEFKLVSAPTTIEGIIVCPENACYFKYYFKSSLPVLYYTIKSEILDIYLNKGEFLNYDKNLAIKSFNAFFDPTYEVGYFNDTGGENTDENYKKTTHIPVVPGRTYTTNARYRYKKYDVFKRDLGVVNIINGELTPEADVYYIRIFFNATAIPFFIDKTNAYYGKEHTSIVASNHVKLKVKTPDKVQTSLSSLPDLQRIEGKVVSGEIGEKGAVYNIPIVTDGVYKIQFLMQYPTDVNSVAESITIAELPVPESDVCQGGFKLELVKSLPVADTIYPRIKMQSGMNMMPIPHILNNYASKYFPDIPLKQMAGEDAFSIRFIGDVTNAANQDICIDVNNDGIQVYHNGGANILTELFPVNKSLEDFVSTILSKTAIGGDYEGVIEIDGYSIGYPYTTDDLIRCQGIKLVADYGGTKSWQAFPFFAPLVDKTYHKIEIVINKNGKTGNWRNKTILYVDGYKSQPTDFNLTFSQINQLSKKLTIGHEDVHIKDFKFEEGVIESSEPFVNVCMLHQVDDDIASTSSGGSSLKGLKRLIDIHKQEGYTFVTIKMIREWLNDKIDLPKKSWSIIHDDAAHLTTTIGKTAEQIERIRKARALYIANGINATFALIENKQTTEGVIKEINDDEFMEFIIHDYDHDIAMSSRTYIDLIEKIDLAKSVHRENFGESIDWVYIGGAFDWNSAKILEHRGIRTSFLISNNLANSKFNVTKANMPTALPRYDADDGTTVGTILFNISQ